ncbi:DUF3568 domain-containing protein [Desulfonema ishimotonii]|uniref:DUF3568 domain-containing protein n=1 Tax=Desulfonema ishimotonii TaxID=45657 RepID=A0A401G3I0_9BACT|nr:DUF3568 family protein [Desulfonema ishimotonii]GBC63790.1 DUF3568 domain-containing protein [Desulfonema ishimotonii]
MNRSFSKWLVIIWCLSATGCTLFAAGAAVTGVGVYTYVDGNLKRSYQATFDRTVLACTETFGVLNISLTEKSSQGVTTVLRGKYYNEKPVTVTVRMAASNITEVSVRSGIIGFWDKSFSEHIHGHIVQQLWR